MRVGPHGLLQPIADALKLLIKEDIIPTDADQSIFWLAPVISTFTGLTAFAVIPFSKYLYVADVNVGLLVISAMSAGWHPGYHSGGDGHPTATIPCSAPPQRGAACELRSRALFRPALRRHGRRHLEHAGDYPGAAVSRYLVRLSNYGFMIVPFVVYIIAATAETNRAPFDLPEAESELVAGFHTEYSGFRWALYFLAEYANIFVISSVAVHSSGAEAPSFPQRFMAGGFELISCLSRVRRLRFNSLILSQTERFNSTESACWGGPSADFDRRDLYDSGIQRRGYRYILVSLQSLHDHLPDDLVCGTFPRFRYDQLMNIGWKVMIPVGMAAIVINALLGMASPPPRRQRNGELAGLDRTISFGISVQCGGRGISASQMPTGPG